MSIVTDFYTARLRNLYQKFNQKSKQRKSDICTRQKSM